MSFSCFEDIEEAVEYINRTLGRKVYIFGVSMGALNVQRFVAEHSKGKIAGAVTISSPWCAHKSTQHIETNFFVKKSLIALKKKLLRTNIHNPVFRDAMEERGYDIGKKKISFFR